VLVSKGTLKSGSCIVAGTTWARVRQMQDDKGKPLREAGPGTPVSVTGWKELPSAGDQLLEAVNGEDEAKRCITNRLREIERKRMTADVEQINVKRAEERRVHEAEAAELQKVKEDGGDVRAFLNERERRAEGGSGAGTGSGAGVDENGAGKKELLLLIKGDVSGTVEAVVGSLEGIGNKEAGVKIIHTGVGEVSESDIHQAEASGGESESISSEIRVECHRTSSQPTRSLPPTSCGA
jgi:translation initiation factor IF-2